MGIPGGTEWLIILLIVLVLFGGKKLPELMGGLGKGIRSFRKGVSGSESDKAANGESLDDGNDRPKKIHNETKQ
ncbi:MAG: twin-arginine translocase TatA/TatE family subunit [Deltaproteobacteria bacterium]|nr:twin-arginine translocase TatA/TatE family subunit [Deltaproteobacteria bacterium]